MLSRNIMKQRINQVFWNLYHYIHHCIPHTIPRMINQHQARLTIIYRLNLHIIGAYLHIIGAYPHNIPIIVSEIYPIVYPNYFLFFKKATRSMITIQISCITDFPICWTVSTPSPPINSWQIPIKISTVHSWIAILLTPMFHPQITILSSLNHHFSPFLLGVSTGSGRSLLGHGWTQGIAPEDGHRQRLPRTFLQRDPSVRRGQRGILQGAPVLAGHDEPGLEKLVLCVKMCRIDHIYIHTYIYIYM